MMKKLNGKKSIMYGLIIYSIGYFVSYFILRHVARKNGRYTIGLRTAAIFISLTSWMMVIIATCVEFKEWYNKVSDKDAKW